MCLMWIGRCSRTIHFVVAMAFVRSTSCNTDTLKQSIRSWSISFEICSNSQVNNGKFRIPSLTTIWVDFEHVCNCTHNKRRSQHWHRWVNGLSHWNSSYRSMVRIVFECEMLLFVCSLTSRCILHEDMLFSWFGTSTISWQAGEQQQGWKRIRRYHMSR